MTSRSADSTGSATFSFRHYNQYFNGGSDIHSCSTPEPSLDQNP